MRILAGLLVLALLGPAAPSPADAAPGSFERLAAPTVTPSTRIPGERLAVHGVVPGTVVRPVALQGKVGGAWTTVTTGSSRKTGAVAFTTGTKATAVRLVAKKVVKAGTTYPAYVSPARTLGTTLQKITLILPASPGAGTAVSAKLTLNPKRAGRHVTLQRLVSGSWSSVKTVTATATTLTIPFTTGAAGSMTSYRAVASAFKGAPALVSATRTLMIKPVVSGVTVQVSKALAAGAQPDFNSTAAQTSSDGRYVVFASAATDLVTGDTNMAGDIFEWDRTTGTTVKVTPTSGNGFTPAVSGDGAWVAYESTSSTVAGTDANGDADIFLWSRATGTTALVSSVGGHSGNAGSIHPDISADGRYVTYETSATDLVTHGTANAVDVVRYDRTAGTTTLVSTPKGTSKSDGSSFEAAISADGRYVTYLTTATDLTSPAASGHMDVVETDMSTGVTSLVTHAAGGGAADSDSGEPSASADGAYVTFASNATNLVADDGNGLLDVFVWSRADGSVTKVSHTPAGAAAHGRSGVPTISGDGRYVAFESTAYDLVPGDSGSGSDVFVWDRTGGGITLGSRTPSGGFADDVSNAPSISQDGAWISFESQADDLVTGDTDHVTDVFSTPH